ncbi:MAG: class A beta-lactamase-related serine hydrolase [Defluviitaleaceae bacterium]|nr:class A beta-lactamase-related serine hydrolase [Defluviitaleaceae bacterium]
MLKRGIFVLLIIAVKIVAFPTTYFTTADEAEELVVSAMAYIHEPEPRPNRHVIERTTGLFENRGDRVAVCHIGPQIITSIEQYGYWVLVDSWMGEKWVNLEFVPPTYELDELLARHGNNLAVFYQNLESGFTYTYNPELILFGASLNKINHALYVYTLAERGYISMETVHTFNEADRRGGTGRIQHMAVGTRFTTRELLWHSMIHSCNVAYRMLINHTRNAEFSYHDFVYEIGANPYFIGNITSQNTNVHDKAIWLHAVHDYIWSDGVYSRNFRRDLLDNPGFILADYPVANKYGWATASFHDAAIVYAPSPYILIILSNFDGGAAGTFRTISEHFQDFNRMWFDD